MGNIVEAGGFGDTRIPTDEDLPEDLIYNNNPEYGMPPGPPGYQSLSAKARNSMGGRNS